MWASAARDDAEGVRFLQRHRNGLVVLGVLWALPATLVLVLHATLPDENPNGQCSGIGFGCTLTPSDGILALGIVAAPFLAVLGVLACLVVEVRRARRERRRQDDVTSAGRPEGR